MTHLQTALPRPRRCATPLVPSASPLGGDLDTLKRLEEAGAGAVVLPSLFEEQIEHEEIAVHWTLDVGRSSSRRGLNFFPELDDYNTGPGAYLEHVAAAKAALEIPVIASLNGSSPGGWIRYARLIEEAGADALELNVYSVEADPATTSDQAETSDPRVVRAVRAEFRIPLAVKIGPFFTRSRTPRRASPSRAPTASSSSTASSNPTSTRRL